MRHLRYLLHYYLQVSSYNAIFAGSIAFVTLDLRWGVVAFCTLGAGVGWLCFHYFSGQQYYGYYNLGHTRCQLWAYTLIGNALAFFPLLLLANLIDNVWHA